MKKNILKDKILISGSIAYDRIMDFSGRFGEHIMPDKIHILNVSFLINDLKEGYGGTAGNIAYNCALLGLKPVILGVVGENFLSYQDWFKKNNINTAYIKKVKNVKTAAAYIITDKDDNQITGFYPGPRADEYPEIVRKIKNARLAIISPETASRMARYVKLYQELKIPFIYDPGQQITSITNAQLKKAINNAYGLIGNDYEIQLIQNRLNLSLIKIIKKVKMLVITKGAKGSVIYYNKEKAIIPPAKPKNDSDPTGAGDAYRSGLIKGIIENWSIKKTGRLAGLISVYTVEKYGTQTHKFTMAGLKKRFQENYKNYSL